MGVARGSEAEEEATSDEERLPAMGRTPEMRMAESTASNLKWYPMRYEETLHEMFDDVLEVALHRMAESYRRCMARTPYEAYMAGKDKDSKA